MLGVAGKARRGWVGAVRLGGARHVWVRLGRLGGAGCGVDGRLDMHGVGKAGWGVAWQARRLESLKRYLLTSDPCLDGFAWWSRGYEYAAVLAEIDTVPHGVIHNAACGAWREDQPFAEHRALYRRFWEALAARGELHLSDLHRDATGAPYPYATWDIQYPWEGELADVVVCVSVLEHIYPAAVPEVKANLLAATKPGGVVILTRDEAFMDEPGQGVLTGATSAHPDERYANLRIEFEVIRKGFE